MSEPTTNDANVTETTAVADDTATPQQDADTGQVADSAPVAEVDTTDATVSVTVPAEARDQIESDLETKATAEPKRVVRRARPKTGKAAGDIPETDAPTTSKRKTAPKKDAATKEDTGKVRETESAAKITVVDGRFPRITSDTTRNRERLADLREKPVLAGSVINPKLVLAEDALEHFMKLAAQRSDAPAERDYASVIFAGSDKNGNVDFIVGTKGDDIVRIRWSKEGKITASIVKLAEVEKIYNLGFKFDDVSFEYWQVDLDRAKQQYRVNWRAQDAEAKRKAEGEAANAAATKATVTKAPTKTGTAKKVTTVKVARKRPSTKTA